MIYPELGDGVFFFSFFLLVKEGVISNIFFKKLLSLPLNHLSNKDTKHSVVPDSQVKVSLLCFYISFK